ncbi:hypothetical protein C2G38_2151011, partial [Gigaspora rosea]
WDSTPNNTNVSENCHAKINRYGTNLNLRIAIERARLDDSKTFHSIETNNKSGIALHGSNHGIISRTKKSIKKATQKISKKRQSDEKSSLKSKVSAKKPRVTSKKSRFFY